MPPKKGKGPGRKKKEKIATKKEIDEIAEIIGVPPIEQRVLRDKDRSMLKFTQLLKGTPRNRAPKVSPDAKNNDLSYFESKLEFHPDKSHRNPKVLKIDLKSQTTQTKLNVHGASKRKLIVPKQVVNEDKEIKEGQLGVKINKADKAVKHDKLAIKIINEINNPTSLYHNTSFREMVYLKETLNDMSDTEFDCILNSSSPVWWEQDTTEREEPDEPPPELNCEPPQEFVCEPEKPPPEFVCEPREPPPELICEPHEPPPELVCDPDEPPPEFESEPDKPPLVVECEPNSIADEIEKLQRADSEETIKKKMILSNLLNNIKQKWMPTSNIEQNQIEITEKEKTVDLVQESDIINDNNVPEQVQNSNSDIATNKNSIQNTANSPVEPNSDENDDTNFIPTVITVIDDLKLQLDEIDDSNPSSDIVLDSGKNTPAIEPLSDYANNNENNIIEELCANAFKHKEINEEVYIDKIEEETVEKELNFLSDICRLKRKHDESDKCENEVKKPCVMTFDFGKEKMLISDSDEDCPKIIVSNGARDEIKKTDDKIEKKEGESKYKQLLKETEMRKARENQNVILKHKNNKQPKGGSVSFGSKDVIIEKYASKLNEQLSKKSRNVTFAPNNDVRFIQPLHEFNKEDSNADIEKADN